LKYPDDFDKPELAGKEPSFKVKIIEVKEEKLPATDDEFAVSLDVEMPIMDGIAFLTAIRGIPATRGIPVILLTAVSEKDRIVQAAKLGAEMAELQDLLFSAGETALLVVLQGMDTSGKDGTIRSITRYVNAQSCRVAAFKAPTPHELAHDFLWRIHPETPAKGSMTSFNRAQRSSQNTRAATSTASRS